MQEAQPCRQSRPETGSSSQCTRCSPAGHPLIAENLGSRREGWLLCSGHGEEAMLEGQGWKAGTAPGREQEESGGPPNLNSPTYDLNGPWKLPLRRIPCEMPRNNTRGES